MSEKKQSLPLSQGITLHPRHVSWIVFGGLVYSGLLFLTGYIIGQRKAVSTLLERFQDEEPVPSGKKDEDQPNRSVELASFQAVNPAHSISLGYFDTPEQAHELAHWAEQTTSLIFKVCEFSDITMPNSEAGAVYQVISESCSNDMMLDTALKRLAPHQEQSECSQFRLLSV